MSSVEMTKPQEKRLFGTGVRCKAIAKGTGERCKCLAIAGRTVCRVHGGKGGRKPTHGMYSSVKRTELKELIDKFEAIDNPLDLRSELAALRAIFEDYINRYDEMSEALLAWKRSWGEEETAPKPMKILDVADAYRILDTISKVVERIERIRSQNAVSRPELVRIMQEMGRVVERHVRDETTGEKIRDDWLRIHI